MADRQRSKIRARGTTHSPKANFIAIILGMATSITLVLLGYDAWHNPVTAQQALTHSQSRLADTPDHPASTSRNGARPKTFDALERLLETKDANKLSNELVRRNQQNASNTLSVRLSDNRKRIRLSERLLEVAPNSKKSRVLAVESIFDGLEDIYEQELVYQPDQENVGLRFRQVATEYQDDPEPRISRIARLSGLKHELYQATVAADDDQIKVMETRLIATMKEYQNDAFALSYINEMISKLWKLNVDICSRLLQTMQDHRQEFMGTSAGEMLSQLRDRKLLADTHYVQQYNNKWVDGAEGQQKLLSTSIEMLNNPDSGSTLIGEVNKVGTWFLQDNRYEQAAEIFQCMVDSADKRSNPATAKLFKSLGHSGLTRTALAFQPFEFSGMDTKGLALTRERFDDLIIIVFFWSLKDSNSIKLVNDLHRQVVQFSSMPIRTLAICIDEKMGEKHNEQINKLPRFVHAAQVNGKRSPMLDFCSIVSVPHVLLVDHHGIIADVDVPPNALATELQRLSTLR